MLTALNLLLSPRLERGLLPGCVAYRPNLGANAAIARVTAQLQTGDTQVATGDVDDFFASLSRQRLLHLLRHHVTPILNLHWKRVAKSVVSNTLDPQELVTPTGRTVVQTRQRFQTRLVTQKGF